MPVSRQDMEKRGWEELDIILISGDAYVDHPSYGTAVVARVLESKGFRVGIIAQPNWRSTGDFMRLGKPKLFFGISAGNVDSMIAHYTANKKPRIDDDYSPAGKTGLRPDRATIVYANKAREAFAGVPIVLGGIEASLRRLSHYDYWNNCVRRSILIDSKADILVYGMGERQIVEIANILNEGKGVQSLSGVRGIAIVGKNIDFEKKDYVEIPCFKETATDKSKFNLAFTMAYNQMNPYTAKTIAQRHDSRYVIQFPPAMPLSSSELNAIYELPYTRTWHPDYDVQGKINGLETVKFSLTSHRGCCGECSFCALYFHQGRIIQSRSAQSIIREAETIANQSDFRGTITDVGGPTANLYAAHCKIWEKKGFCAERKCLLPTKCKGLKLGYDECLKVYRKIKTIPKVKHVFIGSGFRYDLLIDDYAHKYLREICSHNISGLIKVAPEHYSNKILHLMNKPEFCVYEKFVELFKKTVLSLKKNIFIVNYFISSHPGSTLAETLKLALYLEKRKMKPQQIQDFIPSPMTLATCMYWTEIDLLTGKKIYVPKTFRERKMQRALTQYNNVTNKKLVVEALKKLNAMHLFKRFLYPSSPAKTFDKKKRCKQKKKNKI